jgi:hypothetical protein
MDTINFAGAVAVLLFIIAAVSSVFDTHEQKLEAAKDCENRGGVYIDCGLCPKKATMDVEL